MMLANGNAVVRSAAITFRRRSESVTMPRGRPFSSTATTEPVSASAIRRAASAIDTSARLAPSGRAISEPTGWVNGEPLAGSRGASRLGGGIRLIELLHVPQKWPTGQRLLG